MEQLTFILPISTCRANIAAIQETLDIVCQQEPTALMQHLNELASLISLSAQTQASYRFHLEQNMGIYLPKAKELKYPPSLMKDYAYSCMPELVAEYEFSERLNRALTHKADAVRSILSYIKAEIFHVNSQPA